MSDDEQVANKEIGDVEMEMLVSQLTGIYAEAPISGRKALLKTAYKIVKLLRNEKRLLKKVDAEFLKKVREREITEPIRRILDGASSIETKIKDCEEVV